MGITSAIGFRSGGWMPWNDVVIHRPRGAVERKLRAAQRKPPGRRGRLSLCALIQPVMAHTIKAHSQLAAK